MNIKSVYSKGLCTGCGICASVCPYSSIRIVKNDSVGVYVPELDEKMCNKCGLCLSVCPGWSVNFGRLNLDIFGREPESMELGNYIGLYVGNAADYELRYNSSSGGLVTALSIFILKENIVDGVLNDKDE